MTEKTQGKLMRFVGERPGEFIMTPAQVERLTAPDVRVQFVSSRLGDVSCETDREQDAELSVVEAARADLGDRQ
jgi:hypothetical protein